ncbi:MAG: CBS and ACT domain-containing protein [Gemmatimonadetes bacterium]|nr:CBS and ACT domain-containing protein [Gemmatimonadota bacterium]
MTRQVLTVTPTTSIGEAIRAVRTNRIRHLPVVEDGRLVGIVSERDLRLAAPPVWSEQREELLQTLESKKVGEIMSTRVITAAPHTPVEEAARVLYENRIGALPVLDGEELVGILTETDLLRALVELFGGAKPATRLEIRMPNRAGELARVVRVIGIEYKVNIVGLVVPPTPAGEDSVAIIQLSTTNPLPIIEALRKLGYKVGWPAIDLDPDAERNVDPEPASSWRNRVPLEL